MKHTTAISFGALLALPILGGNALAGEWEIDTAHTTAEFSVRHMMVTTVRGQFDKVTGAVSIDDKDVTRSKIDVRIDASTINTREPKRDAHLRSPDFFDVAKYPAITFRSAKIEKVPGGKLAATGDLTMHGVTRSVTLLVNTLTPALKDPFGRTLRGVSATGTLSRKEWGLTYNKALETGGVVISDEVQLQIDAELVAKTPTGGSAPSD